MKLDVGCWDRTPEGFLGLDIIDFGQEYVQDMRDPLPLDPNGNKWKMIRIHHALEHLTPTEALAFIDDCWDKCEEIRIAVPSVNRESAYYLTHESYYTKASFEYFERKDRINYKPWKIDRLVLNSRGDIHCWMKPVSK